MKVTRRGLLAKTSLGVAAASALTAVPRLTTSLHRSAAPMARRQAPPRTFPSVAYVRDATKGEVVLLVGTRKIVRTDPALVAYLGRCCEAGSA